MSSNRPRGLVRAIQMILMFSTAFGVAGLSGEMEHFQISKLGCVAIALGVAGLIAIPSFHVTRYAAKSLAGLRRQHPFPR